MPNPSEAAAKPPMGFLMKLGLFTALALLLLIAMITALYAISVARMKSGNVNIARNYAAELNERYTKPDTEDPAWPHYLRAYAYVHNDPPAIQNFRNADDPPTSSATDAFREWLAANPGFREAALAAAARSDLGYRLQDRSDPTFLAIRGEAPQPGPPSENPLLFGVSLDHLRVTRSIARGLDAHAALAAADGDFDAFLEDIRALLALGIHANQPPTFISQLVWYAALQIMLDQIRTTAHRSAERFPDHTLAELDAILRQLNDDTLRFDVSIERMIFDDVLQRVFTDDGNGDGHISLEGFNLLYDRDTGSYEERSTMMTPIIAAFTSTRAEVKAAYDRIADAAEARAATPIHQWQPSPALTEEGRTSSRGFVQDMLLGLFVPAFERTLLIPEQTITALHATRTAIALERFRRAHGRYPEALAELVPDFLDTLPIDRATGDPLVYRLNDDASPILYSVGLNYTDNGGNHTHLSWRRWLPREELARRLQMTPVPDNLPTGDWVFYPPPAGD